ncbi:MAG: DUF2569 family protein [Thermodesulfobacteriota bacterium]
MCIICGGQCGGIVEILIALGFPFLALYFFRMKTALLKIKNRIIGRDSSAEQLLDETVKCNGGGGWRQDSRVISTQPIELENLELIAVRSQPNESAEKSPWMTKFSRAISFKKKRELTGVRGWLLFLCLNLTIIIPASCIYQAMSIFYLYKSPFYQIILLVSYGLLLYNITIIATMGFLGTLSFYAGVLLWNVKPGAVKITKIFLIIHLSLTVIIAGIRLFITFPFDGSDNVGGAIRIFIPSLLHFSLWYLYLSKSVRVHNTYNQVEKGEITGPLPAKLNGSTEFI